jgi:hypothetical protein
MNGNLKLEECRLISPAEAKAVQDRAFQILHKNKDKLFENSEEFAEETLAKSSIIVLRRWIQHFSTTGKIPDPNSALTIQSHVCLCELFEAAQTDPAAYDAALRIATDLLELGYYLPVMLSRWLAGHLRGETKRPGKSGPSKYKYISRDITIAVTVYFLCLEGVTPTRNDGTNSEKALSGCDIVGEVLTNKFGISMNFDNVKRIWEKHSKNLRTAPIEAVGNSYRQN